jgi:hypothetical protein
MRHYDIQSLLVRSINAQLAAPNREGVRHLVPDTVNISKQWGKAIIRMHGRTLAIEHAE